MKTNVYIVKCESYEKADAKINDLLNLMGGIGQFAKKGEKITLKANLLGAVPPERAVSTHPSIVAAVGKLACAARFLTVDADIEHDKGVLVFYEKNGFIPNAEHYNKNRKTISMRKDIYS